MTANPTPAIQAARRELSAAQARWSESQLERDHDCVLAAQDTLAQASMAALGGQGILMFSHLGAHGHPTLTEQDWLALENAGWTVHWRQKNADGNLNHPSAHDSDDPLDAITPTRRPEGVNDPRDGLGFAFSAAKASVSDAVLVDEWERILGREHDEHGCPCCGVVHTFYWWTPDGRVTAARPGVGGGHLL